MKKYNAPELNIVVYDMEDVCTSSTGISVFDTQGADKHWGGFFI